MSTKGPYQYRLWGVNWLPLFSVAITTMILWGFLKYYDSGRPEDLDPLKWKLAAQMVGWTLLWWTLARGWFALRIAFYGVWSLITLWETGQSVYLHDGFRFILSLILGILFYFAFQWIENALERAGINPRLAWYNGRLQSIPHVKAEISQGESNAIPVQVRAIDETSAFVLFSDSDGPGGKGPFTVKFKYKEKEVAVKAKPIAQLQWEQAGLGLQFFFEDLYHQNQYTKLVQQLKGEGLA